MIRGIGAAGLFVAVAIGRAPMAAADGTIADMVENTGAAESPFRSYLKANKSATSTVKWWTATAKLRAPTVKLTCRRGRSLFSGLGLLPHAPPLPSAVSGLLAHKKCLVAIHHAKHSRHLPLISNRSRREAGTAVG